MSLVYSTESGKICPNCEKPEDDCICSELQKSRVVGDGTVRVSRETKGRKGKGVSLITGLPLNELELKFLAKKLKQRCGVGGSVKNGVIEIQGDVRDTLVAELQKEGYKAKKVGG